MKKTGSGTNITAIDASILVRLFADALHVSALDLDDRLLTFDRDFARMAARTTMIAGVALAQ